MTIWTAAFWRSAFERALKTLCQSLIAILAVGQTSILTVDWQSALAVAATATVLSVLSSIVSSGVGNYGPSLANEVSIPPVEHAHEDIDLSDIDPADIGG